MDTNSEEYRRQCEARKVLSMDHDRRQSYYQGVKDHRKEKGLADLIKEVKKQRKLMSREMEI